MNEDTLIYLCVTRVLVLVTNFGQSLQDNNVAPHAHTHARNKQHDRGRAAHLTTHLRGPRTHPHSLPLCALPSSLPRSLPACLSLLISGLNFCPWRAKAQLRRVALSVFVFSLCAGLSGLSVCVCVSKMVLLLLLLLEAILYSHSLRELALKECIMAVLISAAPAP